MKLQTKSVAFKATAVSEDGTFEGYASVFGNVDLGGDVVHKGAFTKTISDAAGKFPILADHQFSLKSRLGIAEVEEDATGLRVKGHLNLDKEIGRDAYADLKQAKEHGTTIGMSFGYDAVGKHHKGGARHLTEIKLYEVTLTQFPMNPEAGVSDVKASGSAETSDSKAIGHDYGTTDFAEAFAQTEVWRRRYAMADAFETAVYNTLWRDDLTDAEQLDLLLSNADAHRDAFQQWARDLVAAMGTDGMKASAELRQAADDVFRTSIKAAATGLLSPASTISEEGSDGPLSLASLREESADGTSAKGLFSFLNTTA